MQSKRKEQEKKKKQREKQQFKKNSQRIKQILTGNGVQNPFQLYKEDDVQCLKQCLQDIKEIKYVKDATLIKTKGCSKNVTDATNCIRTGGGKFTNAIEQIKKLNDNQYWIGDIISVVLNKYLECLLSYQTACHLLLKDKNPAIQTQTNLIKQNCCIGINTQPQLHQHTQSNTNLNDVSIVAEKNLLKNTIKSKLGSIKQQIKEFKLSAQTHQQYIRSMHKQCLKMNFNMDEFEKNTIGKLRQQNQKLLFSNQQHIQLLKRNERQSKQNEKKMQVEKNEKQMYKKKIQDLEQKIKIQLKNKQQLSIKKINEYSSSSQSQQFLLGPSLAFWSPLLMGYQVGKYDKPKKVFMQERNYLMQVLQQYTGRRVKRTKLIYCYDTIGQADFHLYVDGIPKYVVIMKLKNKYLIGAYSQNALIAEEGNSGPGFIVSLTNKIMISVDTKLIGARTTNYNPYYMIFGNDQFRFQPQKKQVISYVGYQFSFYRPKISQVDLFGIQSDTTQFDNYQVHKVIFEDDE